MTYFDVLMKTMTLETFAALMAKDENSCKRCPARRFCAMQQDTQSCIDTLVSWGKTEAEFPKDECVTCTYLKACRDSTHCCMDDVRRAMWAQMNAQPDLKDADTRGILGMVSEARKELNGNR